MPRYLAFAKLTPAALAARRAEGFTKGGDAIRKVWESVGGTVESTYYAPAWSEWDTIGIVSAPNSDAAFGVASAVMASGAAVRTSVIELRTPEEADAAIAGVQYTPPGG